MWSDIITLAACMFLALGLGLCQAASPSNPTERSIDDQAQIEALDDWNARKGG